MEDLGLPELTSQQIEEICSIAEASAKKHVLSQIPSKKIEALNISAEAEGAIPMKLTVEVDIVLTSHATGFNTKEVASKAVREAFTSAEKYLRELACHSKK